MHLLGDRAVEEAVVLVLAVHLDGEGQGGRQFLPLGGALLILTAPHQLHHAHVLLHDLLRARVDDGETVEPREVVLLHVLLQELLG